MRKLALVLALAACGDKKANDTPAPAPESPKVAREKPAVPGNEPTTNEAKPDEDTPTPTEAAPDAAEAQAAPAAGGGGGKCEVIATAGRDFKQVSAGGPSAANVMQWHTPEMRKKMGYQAEGFVLNCNGEHIKLSIATDRKAALPYGSKQYKVGQDDSIIRVMGTMRNIAISKSAGMLDIEKFDDKRLTGRLTLYINGTSPPTDMFKLIADFDFTCSGLSGCK